MTNRYKTTGKMIPHKHGAYVLHADYKAKRYDNPNDDDWVEAKDGEFVTIDDYNELYKKYLEEKQKNARAT